MNIRKATLFLLLMLSLYLFVVCYLFHDQKEEKLNIITANDIVETLAEQWDFLDPNELPCLNYGLDYVVLDSDSNYLASTRTGLNCDINSAIKNRDTIIDINRNDAILGKLIIYNNSGELQSQTKRYWLTFSISIMVLSAGLCFLFILHIDNSIFRPFRQLKSFAKQVAEGNLDIPLAMDKANHFGAFTESFDLMREELKKARENERIANQSKKELVASLSHDIKTPVASIKAVSEVLSVKSDDDYVRGQLEIINSKADQINTLITNMFTATLEDLQELKVSVSEQPSLILYDLIKKADYNNQVTIFNISECMIVIDLLRLAQVVDNIISNSYKYAGTSIHVSTHLTRNYLEIVFKDFGSGVSEEEKILLFNKFYRAKNSANKSGTGLGLYISRFLVDKMNGEILCENAEDGFFITIKLLLAGVNI